MLSSFFKLTSDLSFLSASFFDNSIDISRFIFLKQNYSNYVRLWYSDKGDPLKTYLQGLYYVIPLYSYLGSLYGVYFRKVVKKNRIHFYAGEKFKITNRLYLFSLWPNFSNFTQDKLIILCEGILDCLFLLQYYPYVISLCGTALTEERIYILSQLGYNFLLFFDNDECGEKTTKRFMDLSKDYNLMYSRFEYPKFLKEKDDPLSFLEKNINIVSQLNRYIYA